MIVGESVNVLVFVDVDSDYSPGFCDLSHVSLFHIISESIYIIPCLLHALTVTVFDSIASSESSLYASLNVL